MSKKFFTLFSILFVISIFLISSFSYASDSEVVLNILLKKGIITQQEFDDVMKDLKAKEESVAKAATKAQPSMPADCPMSAGLNCVVGNVEIAGGVTLIGQGTSNNDDNAAGEDVTDGTLSTDLEISTSVGENGLAFMLVEAGVGEGLQDDEVVSFWGVNDDAGDSDSFLEVTEAWYEHTFFNEQLVFTLGKVDLTNYFDLNEIANDETTQFLSTGLVNSIAVDFPDNSIGARLTISPHELVDISFGWQSGDSDWEDIFDEPFLIAEIGLKPKINQLQGNYRVYAWTNRSSVDADDDEGYGVGTSIDQQVTDIITLFARIGYQDDEVYEFDIAWSAGFQVTGKPWGREADVVGLAYGMAMLGDDYEDTLADDEDEGHFEIYYSIAINDRLTITPDIQLVTDPLGDGSADDVVVGAVRAQLVF